MIALGFILILILNALVLLAREQHRRPQLRGRQLRLGAPGRARRRRGERRARGDLRHQRRRHLHPAGDPADRQAPGRRDAEPTCRESSTSRSTASPSRCCSERCATARAPNMARWLTEHSHRLVEWETDLSSQTGASQAGILLGSNENIPAFRWVEKEKGTLMACSAPDDCAELERRHATGIGLLVERRLQPRQPALGRGRGGHPHRQPDRGGEEGESGLPRLLRQRLQRHASARAVRLGGHPGVHGRAAPEAPRRAAARAPRRHLPVPARRDVRDRARPDRVRRADRHDARPPCRVRDVLELRRGGAPLRASSAPTRSRRCASSTSSSHASTGRAATPRVRTSLVVLSDHGQTQGATFKQRNGYGLDDLVERSLEATQRAGGRGRRRAERDGRERDRRGDRQAEAEAEERRVRAGGGRPRLGQPRARSTSWTRGAA